MYNILDWTPISIFSFAKHHLPMTSPTANTNYEDYILEEVNATPKEYHPALLEIIRLFRESVTLPPAEIGFRRGWTEASLGETKPVYELWEDIDAE